MARPWFAETVRFVVAPLILFWSGFATIDFCLSGVYTWPRSSRILALTLTIAILAYEFVYKEQCAAHPERSPRRQLAVLMTSCAVPYGLGGLTLLAIAHRLV